MKSHPLLRCSFAVLAAASLFATQAFGADKASALNSTDETFVKAASQHGMQEVMVAELGVKKATDPEVKALAEMLVKDHSAANNELKNYAASKNVALSSAAPADASSAVQDLEKKSGKDFDAQFVDDMIAGHKKSIDLFEDSQKNAADADLKAWVEKTLPTLRAHLEHAQKIEKKQ